MESRNTIGAKLAAARTQGTPPLSHWELAERLRAAGLDISPDELAEVEAGKRLLNYYQMTVLAGVLNTTVHELLY